MNNDVQNFIKMVEERQSQYKLEIDEIRNIYKKEIPQEDVITPHVIWLLRREKKKLDKKWGEVGKLSVEKAYGLNEDASASLYYTSGNLSCTVFPNFRNGIGRLNIHRQFKDLLPDLEIQAHLSHPYIEGDSVWARASKDKTNWEILYRNNTTGKSTVKARTKNFCNLRSLNKILSSYEDEWDILKNSHRAIY